VSESSQLHIRPATPVDISPVELIENSSFDDPWPRLALLAELEPDHLRVPLIAEREGRIVGYLMAWRVVDQLHVLNLAVQPACRRHGVGSRLLRASLATAAAAGLKEATLEVRQSNQTARQFYVRHGFVAVGRRRRYYADTGEDAIIMTLTLPAGAP
jgi:ribosomal-protein-alanine N-acetyltransferase